MLKIFCCWMMLMIHAAVHDQVRSLLEQSQSAYRTFRPRPDQPDRFDQQDSFVNSRDTGVSFFVGGNGSGTSECAAHKVSKFVLSVQPPPREDTPFWCIANTYEQICKAFWKEKLYGHGHLPPSEVQWDRIRWYREMQGWPYEVPLKPWPGKPGRNWTLVFKSYEQGRTSMQAESIGGFCFVEQFPWGLLEEVLRGCREYNFPGSKMCEFTPIDPALSYDLERLIEEDRLPAGWKIYRANTECAVEAGHVSKEWFEEFFGMIPEEMLLTRMTGEFASYEGLIYQGFNPRIHLGDDKMLEFPEGVQHRRTIDWGAGPENAFACEWAYRNGLGQWFVYDEYYSTDQNKTVMDHLDEIREKHDWPKGDPNYGTTWADPSSPDCIRIAQRCGFSISPARNAVYEGIDEVRKCLKLVPGVGKPRLVIHRENCKNLARQMRTYRWLRGSDRGANPRDARPEPLKKDDHAVDALRYLLFSEASMTGITPSRISSGYNPSRHGVLGVDRDDGFGANGHLLGHGRRR